MEHANAINFTTQPIHFVSPTYEIFSYSTTDRNGYRIYKRKGSSRVLTRHIWQDYIDIAEIIRLTPHGKETYKLRSETVERVFGDAKEKHAMRWTTLRGLANIQRQATMTFACMNLKKVANWLAKRKAEPPKPSPVGTFLANFFSFLKLAWFYQINRKPTSQKVGLSAVWR